MTDYSEFRKHSKLDYFSASFGSTQGYYFHNDLATMTNNHTITVLIF